METQRRVSRRAGWTLEEGLTFARTLQAIVLPLRHWVALGGSVLYKGESRKDLDLVVAPYNRNEGPAPSDVVAEILAKVPHIQHEWPCAWIHAQWRERGGTDTKHVEAFKIDDGETWRRVDIFFLA